jgi:hypothetical protein
MARIEIRIPNWVDRIFAWPVMIYRWLKLGYTYRRISLGEGRYTLVDSADYNRLNKYRWYADGKGDNIYAVRNAISETEDPRTIRMHREIMNAQAGVLIDHRNTNALDNRRDNLREATKSQNGGNKRPNKTKKTSRYKGVTFRKDIRKWTARIGVQGKSIWLGRYDEEGDAARAYDAAAKKYFGEFARLNFSD